MRLNGDFVGQITPRGRRQGDPLSPYLFVLYTQGLSALIKKNLRAEGIYTRSRCVEETPILAFLLFAYKCFFFIFCRVDESEANIIIDILNVYGAASGQLINFQKSKIIFSSNTNYLQRQYLSSPLGVTESIGTSRYLRLPSIIGK